MILNEQLCVECFKSIEINRLMNVGYIWYKMLIDVWTDSNKMRQRLRKREEDE